MTIARATRLCGRTAFAVALVAVLHAFWSTAHLVALSSTVVISQVYGGGGNTGATLKNDFIELYNRGTVPVDLTGWSVQYGSAAGTTWQKTDLTGVTLAPGQYYLIQEAAGTGGTTNLPTPDAIGTIAMSASSGKVALVSSTGLLTGACPSGGLPVDFVGYGTSATCFEGSGPTATLSNTTAARRQGGGCTDTNNNASDFFAGTPVPRNSGVAASCTVQTGIPLAIHEIQGPGTASPYAAQVVTTTGVVTAVKTNGFFLQAPDSETDSDPKTSEGVFVFTSSTPPASVALGNYVTVTGTVQEFRPDPNGGSITEIAGGAVVTTIASGFSLPTPKVLTAADTSPAGGPDVLEAFEGMRVGVPSLTVVAPTGGTISEANATSTSNGVFYGVITGLARPLREPGVEIGDPLPAGAPANVPRYDSNPERIRVDSDALVGAPKIEVTTGAIVTGLVGPLDYAFRSYAVYPDPAAPPTVAGNIAAIPVPAATATEFTVASFNMERWFDTVDDANVSDVRLTEDAFARRVQKASLAIRNVLRMPDLIGVEEVEKLPALEAIAARISADAVAAAQPDPHYQAILIEGNDVGGIDVGFLVKQERVAVTDVLQFGKDDTYINPLTSQPELLNDRPSLQVHATFNVPGARPFPVTVIVNHLRSLSGIDAPDAGARVRAKRRAQAEFLANYVQALQTAKPDERIVLVGDFNAFQFNDGYVDVIGTIAGTPTAADEVVLASDDLVDPNLVDLVDTPLVPADQRYSFVFDGTAQELDHVLVTQNVLPFTTQFAYGRVNADFPESLRADATRPERLSDHDPVVAFFSVPLDSTLTYRGPTTGVLGQSLSVSVEVGVPGGAPTGEVTFTLGDGPSARSVTATVVNREARATFDNVQLFGPQPLSITYSGDGAYPPSSILVSVEMMDATPPTIASVTPNTTTIWPPTRQMVPVTITSVATDNVDPHPACSVAGVASNEGTAVDWEITSTSSVNLRADRNGRGSGRIYAITVRCTDASGNAATSSTTVIVPHDQRPGTNQQEHR